MKFASGLCLLFIGLKLASVNDWNWIWVLSPLWINQILNWLTYVGIFTYFMCKYKDKEMGEAKAKEFILEIKKYN